MSRDFERRAWIIVGAMLIAAVIAHFAADAAVAQAAHASKLSKNQANLHYVSYSDVFCLFSTLHRPIIYQ